MPFFIKPFFRKPFKLFAIDADTGQPLDPNVHRKTRVTYYELANGSNGSKKLVAHKSASNVGKEGGEEGKAEEAQPAEGEATKEGSKKEGSKKEGSKKGDEAKVEQKGNDVAWTPEEDEKLKAMKGDGKTWAEITVEMGRHKGQLNVRWKEIKPPSSDDKGKMPADGKGGDSGKGQNDKEKQNGGNGGQGKQGKKGKKGGDNQQNQNNNNNQKKNDNKNKNHNHEKSNQDKKEAEEKTSSKTEEPKPSSNKPASNKPTSKPASNSNNADNNETRFTMTDWLTLQEDDMFSFGELQCLSELIGKDLGQSWQRVAAKFFDLTGRRIHPDDVRDKFERMAVMAQGGK
jgi:hypothetical protein